MIDVEYIEHTPLTEDEVNRLIPDGNYPAFIKDVVIKSGRKDPNKKYFVAYVEVEHKNRKHTLITWLALPYLLKHMYDSVGKSEKYKESKLHARDCRGLYTVAKVKKQEGDDKYPSRNVIADFLVKDVSNLVEDDLNDDVPF